MPSLETTTSVSVAFDELVGIECLEQAAWEFAQTAPAELISTGVDAMVGEFLRG